MDRRSNLYIPKGARTTLGRGVKPLVIKTNLTDGVLSEDKFTITYKDPEQKPVKYIKSQIVTGIQNMRDTQPTIDLTLPGKNTPVSTIDPPKMIETSGGSLARKHLGNLPVSLGRKNNRNNIKLIL